MAIPLNDNRRVAALSNSAADYAWRQLATRAGVRGADSHGHGFEELKLPIHYGAVQEASFQQPGLIVVPCREATWAGLTGRSPGSLDWLPPERVFPPGHGAPYDEPTPVLLWGEGYEDGSKPFAEQREDGSVVFYADIVAATFFMLSRWEETVVPALVPALDQHSRFPATASVAYRQNLLNRPVVDEYGLILRAWLRLLMPRWEAQPRRFTVMLSHDIDHVRRFSSPFAFARALGGDLLKRRSPALATETVGDAITQILAPDRSPYLRAIYTLAALSRKHGLDSAFYFMVSDASSPEGGYDVAAPQVRQCIAYLQEHGFEVGLHPGYDTLNNPALLAAEKARLDAILGKTRYGGRQHFLRFQVPDTWRHWEQVGLDYDSTLGYADHEGFRCGTCHPFRPFDVDQDRELHLIERPLVVMDVTLHHYRALKPAEGETRIIALARRCQQVGGEFSLLWHNSSLRGEMLPWAATYERVLERLAAMQASARRVISSASVPEFRPTA